MIEELRLPRYQYRMLHQALEGLRKRLHAWNEECSKHGTIQPPYTDHVMRLDVMIEWGREQLDGSSLEIVIDGISAQMVAYAKEAVVLAIHQRDADGREKTAAGWPPGAVASLSPSMGSLRKLEQYLNRFPYPPIGIVAELATTAGSDFVAKDKWKQ